MRRTAILSVFTFAAACAVAQESGPASRPWQATSRPRQEALIEVQDQAGDPVSDAKVRRRAFGLSGPPSPPDRERLAWDGSDTGKDGKARVLVPWPYDMEPLIVFKPGYRFVAIDKPGAVNRVVLRDGVQVEARLPAWIRLPAEYCDGAFLINHRDARIYFLPGPDEVWWKSQSTSLYSSRATKRTWSPASRETPGQWSPRRVSFKVEPGRYAVRLTLVTDTILRWKFQRQQNLDGTYPWEPFIPGSPPIITIPDTKDVVTLELNFDRDAYDKTGFAMLPEARPASRFARTTGR